jgi:hypothetical protein
MFVEIVFRDQRRQHFISDYADLTLSELTLSTFKKSTSGYWACDQVTGVVSSMRRMMESAR